MGIQSNQLQGSIRLNVIIMTDYKERPREAYILSMAGGIIIATVGLSWAILMTMGWTTSWFDWLDLFMHGGDSHSHFWDLGSLGYIMASWGVVIGVSIVLASVMLNRRPNEHGSWGVVIIVLSAVSMIGGMGGMGIGLFLGIVGGILAVLWQPPSRFQMLSEQE